MRWIAKSYHQLGNKLETYRWYYRALGEAPSMREPYVEFAQAADTLGDWSTCLYMAKSALLIEVKSSSYINMGYAWDFTPYDLAALASYNLGLAEDAVNYGKTALSRSPTDQRLKANLEFYLAAVDAVHAEQP